MTSPLPKKLRTTQPSIRRWIRLSPLPVALLAVLLASERGMTAENKPATRSSHSRLADVRNAAFFEKTAQTTALPLAPAPAPSVAGLEPVAMELAAKTPQVRSAHWTCLPSQGAGKAGIEPAQALSPDDEESGLYRTPVNDPRKLKRITDIQPFANYEPDPKLRQEDPCKNLCPRPDGLPCQPGTADQRVPECPEEVVLSNESFESRCFSESVFAWEASNVYYNPLYFEDAPLERYGHTYPCWVQPFASIGKFSVQLAGLPYQMTIDPVCKKIYPLGYYRPGECAPKLHYQVPWNTRAAINQAGVTTGLIFLIP